MPTSPDDNYYIDKVDDPLARSSANTLVGLGTELVGKIYHHFQDKKQATQAAKAYANKYCDRYCKIRLLGMSQDINLEDVYTAVKFLDRLSINNRFGSINALEDDYRNAGKRRFQRGKCQSVKGSKVANENLYLYVLGNPGAGKSTFLRRVGLEALKGNKGNYQHDLIPVMIELKQFNQGKVDLIDAISNKLAYFNFPDKRKATEDYLKQGKLLLLFDALDEVPQAYANEVQNNIDNLKTKYSDNRFILSCRIAAYKSSLTGFTTVELADFDDKQIVKFIHNWFSSELDKQNKVAEECWTKLSQPEYQASLELAQTPLLLTFLCITYDTYQDFPAQRSQLYSEALDILLRKWDAQKRIKRDKIYANWNINLELALLAELAYDFFSRDELFFTKESILEYIQVFLSDTEGDAKFIDSEAVLDAIAIQQGILVERATGIYSFSHLTLQEYLTAKYISQDNRRIENLVEEHLTDERWQEIFLLVSGIRDNADDFLLFIDKKIKSFVRENHKLSLLLNWSANIINTESPTIKPALKRILMLSYILPISHYSVHAEAKTSWKYLFIINFLNSSKNYNFRYLSNLIVMEIGSIMSYLYGWKTFYAEESENIKPFRLDYFVDKLRQHSWEKISTKVDFKNLVNNLMILSHEEPIVKNNYELNNIRRNKIREYAGSIIDTWIEAFNIDSNLLFHSDTEIKIFDSYIYSDLCIVNLHEIFK